MKALNRQRIKMEMRFWFGVIMLILAWPFVLVDEIVAYFDKDK